MSLVFKRPYDKPSIFETIAAAVNKPFDLIERATVQYIVHENFYTRLAHLPTSWLQLLPILILLNFFNVSEFPISVGMLIAGLIAIYFIYLEWFVGILSAILMFVPLILLKMMQEDGMSTGAYVAISLISFSAYWVFGILQLVCHRFDGVRSLILHPKPRAETLTVIFYNTLASPFFFLLFLMVSLGYKRSSVGEEIKERYALIVKKARYPHKPMKVDKNGVPIDKYNKPHPLDLT